MIRPRVTILILTNACNFGVTLSYSEQVLYGQFLSVHLLLKSLLLYNGVQRIVKPVFPFFSPFAQLLWHTGISSGASGPVHPKVMG